MYKYCVHVYIVQFFPLESASEPQGRDVTFGGVSGVLRPLAQASESASYSDVGLSTILTEGSVTLVFLYHACIFRS